VYCRGRESVEVARTRALEALLRKEIADLNTLITRAKTGQFTTEDRLAIGPSEEATKAMLDASLPQERLEKGLWILAFTADLEGAEVLVPGALGSLRPRIHATA
jgi:hypothetical protein